MGGWEPSFATSLSQLPEPPPGPPAPVSATYFQAAARLVVHFDQLLNVEPQSASNWLVRHDRQFLIPFNLSVLGSNVVADVFVGGPTSPGSLINYLATPPQVRNVALDPAAPFTGFPLTVNP